MATPAFRQTPVAQGARSRVPPLRLWSWPRIWAVSLSVCIGIAVLQVAHGYMGFNLAGLSPGGATLPTYETRWSELLRRSLPSWAWIGLVAPSTIWLARRFPLAPELSRGYLLLHLVGALGFAALCVAGASSLRYALFVRPVTDTPFRVVMLSYYALYYNYFFLHYWTIVGVYSMVRYYREAQVRRFEGAELEAVATKARLDALRRQLQPHFLFNLLSAISSLVLEGNRRMAVHALSDLGQLLRASFSRDEPFIPLRDELEFLDLYVDLHRLRLGDRVRIAYSLDRDATDLPVPTFLLQPLVENAIEHGAARIPEGGTVRVTARVLPRALEITVSNPLPALSGRAHRGSGVGLANTRERIQRSYGGAGTFDFAMGPDEAVARIVIPVSDPPGRRENGRGRPAPRTAPLPPAAHSASAEGPGPGGRARRA